MTAVNNESQQVIAALHYPMCQTKKIVPTGVVIVIRLLKAIEGRDGTLASRG